MEGIFNNFMKTISLKITPELYAKLKKASKIRGITMSEYIRQAFEPKKSNDIFKYFGKFDEDEQLKDFDKALEKRKKGYKMRKVDL